MTTNIYPIQQKIDEYLTFLASLSEYGHEIIRENIYPHINTKKVTETQKSIQQICKNPQISKSYLEQLITKIENAIKGLEVYKLQFPKISKQDLLIQNVITVLKTRLDNDVKKTIASYSSIAT